MDYTLQFISTQWGLLGAFFAFDPVLLSEPGMIFRLVFLAVLLCAYGEYRWWVMRSKSQGG